MVQLAALAANGGRRDGAEHLLVSRRFGGPCDPGDCRPRQREHLRPAKRRVDPSSTGLVRRAVAQPSRGLAVSALSLPSRRTRANPRRTTDEQPCQASAHARPEPSWFPPWNPERRSQAIVAFLGTGMDDPPTAALCVQALAGARRSAAILHARHDPSRTGSPLRSGSPASKRTPLPWPRWKSPSSARKSAAVLR